MPHIQENALTGAALPTKEYVLAASQPANFAFETSATLGFTEKQKKAWTAYDQVGEIHYIANALIGASLETLSFYGAIEDTATTYNFAAPVEGTLSDSDAEYVRKLVEGLHPKWGQQQDFVRTLGINLFVCGEGFHLTRPKGGGEFEHEFVPKKNITKQSKAANGRLVEEYKDPITNQLKKVGDGGTLSRIWRPHPADPGKADSPLFAILDLLDELQWIQKLMNSTLRKRVMTSGLFVMTNSILGPDYNPGDATSTAGAVNSVERTIIEQLSRNIDDDEASPALPLLLFAPFEHVKDGFNHIDFGEQLSEVAIQERNEILRRIATALDVPTEFVTGIGEVNHWSAWLIRDLLWTQHVQSLATLIVNSLTHTFLRPALRRGVEKGFFEGDPETVKLWFRASHFQTHPDLFTYLLKAHEKGIIGAEPILQALGIPPDVAITEEEFELWKELALKQRGVQRDEDEFPSRERTGNKANEGPANRGRSNEDGPSAR